MKSLLTGILLFFSVIVMSQDVVVNPTDSLFQLTRTLSEEKKYDQAIDCLNQIIAQDSVNNDAFLFRARVYSWKGDYSKSLVDVGLVLERLPANQEAWDILFNVLLWQKKHHDLLDQIYESEKVVAKSENTFWIEANTLVSLGEEDEAISVLEAMTEKYPNSERASQLLEELLQRKKGRFLTPHLGYSYFTNTSSPRTDLSLDYQQNLGKKVIGIVRASGSHRFDFYGAQLESDVYAQLFKRNYTFFTAGISNGNLFPDYRFGIEPYFQLHKHFEVSIGNRYMKFENSELMIYTASLVKYHNSMYFSGRTYLTPTTNGLGQSYNFEVRKYLKSAENYWVVRGGFGVSPDADYFGVQFQEVTTLTSYKVVLGYYDLLKKNRLGVEGFYEFIDHPTKVFNVVGFDVFYRIRLK